MTTWIVRRMTLLWRALRIVDVKLDGIIQQGVTLMAKVDELNAELIELNTTTDELATDVADLIAKMGVGGLSAAEADAIKSELTALKAKLQGVASQHTPGTV